MFLPYHGSPCTSCGQDGGDATIMVLLTYMVISFDIGGHNSNCLLPWIGPGGTGKLACIHANVVNRIDSGRGTLTFVCFECKCVVLCGIHPDSESSFFQFD